MTKKCLLLLEFARGKRHLHFEATSGTRTDQLADFSARLAEATGRTALSVPDWRAALDAVADWAQEGPVLLVDAAAVGFSSPTGTPRRVTIKLSPRFRARMISPLFRLRSRWVSSRAMEQGAYVACLPHLVVDCGAFALATRRRALAPRRRSRAHHRGRSRRA